MRRNVEVHRDQPYVFSALNVDQLSITADALTATPEPASISLVATGLVGVFGVALRRRMV